MITEGILNCIFGFFKILVDFLPSFSIGGDLASVLGQVSSWLGWANYYVPLEDFVGSALIVLSVWLVCAVVSFIITIF